MPKRRPYRHLAHLDALHAQPLILLTVVTHERRRLLATPFAHHLLRGLWQRSAERNHWLVGDYVLMPDHVHLFVRPAADAHALASWVKMWKSVSARAWIADGQARAPVWQQEYFDRFVRSDESYAQKWEYVRNNPVRAGLVSVADPWPFMGRIFDLS